MRNALELLTTAQPASANRGSISAAIEASSAAKIVLGHSCERAALEQLERHIPRLRADLATGDQLDL